ncbi:MAG: hypothetical protein ACREEK_20540 [Bradyrhizobium sp.]
MALRFAPFRIDILARRRIDTIPGEIVHDGTECDGRKICLFVIVPGPRDKLDDVCTHWGSSHIAIAIRPISASDIRYAVIGFSLEKKRGMIAGVQSFQARTVSLLQGPLAAVALATPRAGTFARAG